MSIEKSYRPTQLKDYCGQPKIKQMINIYTQAAKMRHEVLDHIIIHGPSGMGKSTIAHIIAKEMGVNCVVQAAPALKKKEDLLSILSNLTLGDVLFLDEIHSLNKKMQEVLFVAMEEFYINICDEEGVYKQDLPHFTLIGATTDLGKLSEPILNRFPITLTLLPYENEHIKNIISNSFKKIGINIDDNCAEMIASRSRGVPRRANNFVRRVYDFATVLNDGNIDKEIIEETFVALGINKYGLTKQDMDYLTTLGYGRIVTNQVGCPIGLDTIASSLNTDKATIENVIEPYLLQNNYVIKTPRGRMITTLTSEMINNE